jgi:hypothetical protein
MSLSEMDGQTPPQALTLDGDELVSFLLNAYRLVLSRSAKLWSM